ncbi:MAG TPA: flagellar biosynthetic protein FliR [Candidatus Sulfotelmatobacter sp.]|nr:flagellar biosynthetic protein FliR [Candidatus Sulfotelmatobacter sp.]
MNELHIDQVLAAAVFIGARVSGLMVYCPFLSSDAISTQLKAVLTLLITALLYPLHGPLQLDLHTWQWAGIALSEVVIGLLFGLTANFMLEAPMLAGQILGVQMGYSLATLFDPQTQADTPVLAEFHRLAALLIFLAFDIHHWMLRAIVRSFAYLPAGALPASYAAAGILHAARAIFLAGLQIAGPGLAATLVTDVALGFLGKASPQLPVLFVGLAVKNLVGLTILIAIMAYWPNAFSQRFAESIAVGERLLRLAH